MNTTNMNTTNNTEVADKKKVSIKLIALYAFIGSLIVSTGVNIRNAAERANMNADTVIEAETETEVETEEE